MRAQAAAIEVADAEARDIVIETDAVRAVFTNRGAALKSWRLNHYKDQAGKPVDLVPQTLPDAPKPFQIETGNSAVDARANAALFRVVGGGATRDEAKGTLPAGLRVPRDRRPERPQAVHDRPGHASRSAPRSTPRWAAPPPTSRWSWDRARATSRRPRRTAT